MNQAVVPLNVFSYQEITSYPVRTIIQHGELLFVAADVCKILDITNVSQAVENLDEDEKGISTAYTLGGPQSMICVNESGLYHLIFQSRKPEAKAFRRWVTKEVLPSIRKTGSYSFNEPRRLQPNSAQYELEAAEEEMLILRYVNRLGTPTARDLSRYMKRYPVSEIRLQLHDLAEQGKLIEERTGKSLRYKKIS